MAARVIAHQQRSDLPRKVEQRYAALSMDQRNETGGCWQICGEEEGGSFLARTVFPDTWTAHEKKGRSIEQRHGVVSFPQNLMT